MRQGQQNRRGRGRSPNHNNNNNNNNNNRKSQNPLTRSFESAGPDVKLRGTPSHIAEKYVTLARDALSSGDPVLAENYLQHAEHYNRIILTFREQQVSQGGDPYQNSMARTHSLGSEGDGDEMGDEEGDEVAASQQTGGQPEAPQPNFQPPQQRYDNRPRHDNQHRGDNRHGNQQRYDRGDRQDRFGGDQRGFRDDRGQTPGQSSEGNGYRRRDRFGGERHGQGGGGQNFGQGNGAPQDQGPPNASPNGFDRPAPTVAQSAPSQPQSPSEDQPAFLRRPVRRPRREEEDVAPAPRPVGDEQE